MQLHKFSSRKEIEQYAKTAYDEFKLRVVYLKEPEFANVIRIFGTAVVGMVTFRMKEK